jgi:hypothetical protein
MKVFIDDPVKRYRKPAQEETELESDTTIRFETDTKHFLVSLKDNVLKVHTFSHLGTDKEQIRVLPKSSNVIEIE